MMSEWTIYIFQLAMYTPSTRPESLRRRRQNLFYEKQNEVMRRIINCFFAFLLFAYAGCDTAGNVDPVFKETFIRYYGTEGDQYASDLMVNEDGTMIILANSLSLSGERKAFVIKVNAEGDVIWQTDVGQPNVI